MEKLESEVYLASAACPVSEEIPLNYEWDKSDSLVEFFRVWFDEPLPRYVKRVHRIAKVPREVVNIYVEHTP